MESIHQLNEETERSTAQFPSEKTRARTAPAAIVGKRSTGTAAGPGFRCGYLARAHARHAYRPGAWKTAPQLEPRPLSFSVRAPTEVEVPTGYSRTPKQSPVRGLVAT